MSNDSAAITRARSLLMILIATCEQTLLALKATDNALDTDLTNELRKMIGRSTSELAVLTDRLTTARG